MGTPGFEVRDGYKNVSHRGYTNSILEFNDCRVPKSAVLGEVHKGFEVANTWLGATRLQVAATCLGPRGAGAGAGHAVGRGPRRSSDSRSASSRVSASSWPTWPWSCGPPSCCALQAAWKMDQGTATDMDMAIAKLKATEMLAMVADEALQIHGGMGLMSDLPLERIWRDARIERIWEGTSEIQRHIISRALLRPLGGLNGAGLPRPTPRSGSPLALDQPQALQLVDLPLHRLQSSIGVEDLEAFRAQVRQDHVAELVIEHRNVGCVVAVRRGELRQQDL